MRLPNMQEGDEVRDVPRDGVSVAFTRASGAGGQNVNKVNTKVELRLHVDSCAWMCDGTRARLKLMNPLSRAGELIVTSQVHRTQEANLKDAWAKLAAIVRAAARIPKVRNVRTGLSELTKATRREDKRMRAEVKARRKGSGDWED